MEIICNRNKCTGCTTCMNICPKGAINMIEDECGFKQPIIDQSKCINCGLCQRICPVLNLSKNESINKCYVGYAKEKKYKEHSSSGGIFTVIAEKVLLEGGVVIGAYLEKNKLNHICIDNINDLHKLQGSKYLQSNLNDIFCTIKENIDVKKVLFIGTPCQVAGLKAYLKRDYDNLITIDLFCHGVPSPKLFDKYVKELENNYNDELVKYDFRDKSTGWDTYSNNAIFKNKEVKELNTDNDYMKLFLGDNALRESCYNCNFKLGNKYSDITLGDFWGVKSYYPEMYNKEGVSAIIVNTDKGLDVFKTISSYLEYKDCKLEEILSGNPSLEKSAILTNKRSMFFDEIYNKSISELSNKYKRYVSFTSRIKNKIKKIFKK